MWPVQSRLRLRESGCSSSECVCLPLEIVAALASFRSRSRDRNRRAQAVKQISTDLVRRIRRRDATSQAIKLPDQQRGRSDREEWKCCARRLLSTSRPR